MPLCASRASTRASRLSYCSAVIRPKSLAAFFTFLPTLAETFDSKPPVRLASLVLKTLNKRINGFGFNLAFFFEGRRTGHGPL